MGLKISTRIDSHTEEFKRAMTEQAAQALDEIGFDAASTTSKTIRDIELVDTGRLMNSIDHEVVEQENAVYVGTNVEYAPYHEFGTSRGIKAKHFLQFGVSAHQEEYKKIIEEKLKQ